MMNNENNVSGENVVREENTAKNEIKAEENTIVETPIESEAPKPKKKALRRGVPVWVLIISIFLAALITFQTTFVILAGKYGRELNLFRAQRSTVSPKLGKAYTLIDEISSLFEENYIYELDYDAMIERILYDYAYETNDRYAQYITADEWEEEQQVSQGNSAGIGVMIVPVDIGANDTVVGGLYITRVMNDGPSQKAGLSRGDVIIAVDDKNIIGMKYDDVLALTPGESGSTVKITVLRNGEELCFDVVRGSYTYETVDYKMIEKDGSKIGYINITEFYEITVEQFKNAVEELKADGCDGLVFDMRGNPGGYLSSVYYILDYILPTGPVVKLTYADGKEETFSSDWRCISGIPMAVVVNDGTASAAELFTAALKDYNYATVVGTKTYGKGCGQDIFPLSNGGYVKLTTFLYSPPFSGNYDGVGIIPDVNVELEGDAAIKNIFILTEEEDTQLSAAINNILNKIK